MMLNRLKAVVVTVLLAGSFIPALAAGADALGFEARTIRASESLSMPYRLHIPEPTEQALPLIVYLHGAGGWGTDNLAQISTGNTHGTQLWLKPEVASQHPAFVVAPQLPSRETWGAPGDEDLTPHAQLLIDLIAQLAAEFAIDSNRVYIIGQSLGGIGVWDLISKRPDLFAAAVPICGFGNVERITEASELPIWAFHGAQDNTVPVKGSRDLVAALRGVGGDIRYTEYPDVGHTSWEQAFAEPELIAWLFDQRR